MKMRWLAVLGLLLGALTLRADDVTDWIEEGLKAYRAGDLPEAAQNLEYAAQLIRQQKGDKLSEALPAGPSGWTRTEVGGTAAGTAMFGGGTGASATYERQSRSGEEWSTVTITIATDNPMLGAMLGMFANPMLLSSQGRRLVKVGGEKASLEFDAEERSGELSIVVAQKVLVTVSGSGLSEEELRAFAEAVDFDLIRELSAN